MTIVSVIASDISTFFNKDEFAVEATLASTAKINVIFDYNPDFSMGVENAEIQVTAKYSDVSSLVAHSTMVIGGVTYYLLSTPKNEDGIAILKLSKN